MSETNGNELVINPDGSIIRDGTSVPYMGLTKREYFAGLAMSGLVAGVVGSEEWKIIQAVRMADALLAELDKK